MTGTGYTAVSDMAGLRTVYEEPALRAAQKVLDRLDTHCRNFIALSPFCILSTADAEGRADASPRGDPPGFVKVLDERTLLLPDRPGNNQIDSLRNVVENPGVGLLFFVPGMNETLRVNGQSGDRHRPRVPGALGREPQGAAVGAAGGRRGSLPALRTGVGPIAAVGPGGPDRPRRLSHLRPGARRPDRRRRRARDRRVGGRSQPRTALLRAARISHGSAAFRPAPREAQRRECGRQDSCALGGRDERVVGSIPNASRRCFGLSAGSWIRWPRGTARPGSAPTGSVGIVESSRSGRCLSRCPNAVISSRRPFVSRRAAAQTTSASRAKPSRPSGVSARCGTTVSWRRADGPCISADHACPFVRRLPRPRRGGASLRSADSGRARPHAIPTGGSAGRRLRDERPQKGASCSRPGPARPRSSRCPNVGSSNGHSLGAVDALPETSKNCRASLLHGRSWLWVG